MKILFLVLVTAFSNFLHAQDLGKLGRLYEISEISPLVLISEKAKSMVSSGRWDEFQKKKKEEIISYLTTPPGYSLPKSLEYKKTLWDSTYKVEKDIYTKEGRMIARAGDIINPLNYRRMLRQYCFFDLADPRQVEWAEFNCGNPVKSKAIAVNGNYMEYAEKAKFPIFFDQYGKLVDRFLIKKLPSIVRQIGSNIYVEEYPTH